MVFMLTDKISQQQVERLSEEIKHVLHPKTFDKGWEYNKRGYVYNVVILDTKIQATVQGAYRYLVRIDIDNIGASKCSCPVQTRCKHIAAAFFYLYSLYYNPDIFMQQLKTNFMQAPNAILKSKNTGFVPELPTQPGETSSVEQWYKYMEADYDQYVTSHQKDYNSGLYFNSNYLNHIFGLSTSWHPPLNHFFLFHAHLFVLMQMEKRGDRLHKNEYYLPEYNSRYVGELTKRLFQLGEKFNQNKIRSEYSSQFGAVIKSLRELIIADKPHFWVNWLYIYRFLWTELLNDKQWVSEEISYLDNLLANEKLSTTTGYNVRLARGHFILLNGNNNQFMPFMDRAPQITVGDMLNYLRGFRHEKQWDRMAEWLRWLGSRIPHTSQQEFDVVCGFWTELSKKRQYRDESLEVFKSWLPKSLYYFSHALIQSGRYKTWVNLHIFYQNLPEDIDPAELAHVEKADLNLALPLYHHFILRLIMEKKRDSYKKAVSLLKKLQKFYTKLKSGNDWERYINCLDNQFSRLRAFKAELRKGKLING